MSFEHMGYKIERLDENNVCLYHWRAVNHVDKETKAVTTTEEWVRLGFCLTFFGAATRLIDRLAEEATSIDDLRDILHEWQFIQKELSK
jgi:hypothetical protein